MIQWMSPGLAGVESPGFPGRFMVRAERSSDPGLLLRADGGEHLRPAVLRQRDEMPSDPARRGVHEAAHPRLDPGTAGAW